MRLRGDEIWKDIVVIYIYDTKSSYLSSDPCKENKWVKNHRHLYNNQEEKAFNIIFTGSMSLTSTITPRAIFTWLVNSVAIKDMILTGT